jgi:hypothetical protein
MSAASSWMQLPDKTQSPSCAALDLSRGQCSQQRILQRPFRTERGTFNLIMALSQVEGCKTSLLGCAIPWNCHNIHYLPRTFAVKDISHSDHHRNHALLRERATITQPKQREPAKTAESPSNAS